MHETKAKVAKLCALKDKIQDFMDLAMCSDLSDKMSVEQAGEFIDMIKDLYDAEKNAWKACYYKKMVEGMEPPTEEERKRYMQGPMGYDNWRYSSGRFAPSGHGHYAGYMMDEEIYGPDKDMMYGYTSGDRGGNYGSRSMTASSDTSGYHGNPEIDRYGRAYSEWNNARRHYTETKSATDKSEMDMRAKEHLNNSILSMKELWKNGDVELRKEIKKDLTALINEMPA